MTTPVATSAGMLAGMTLDDGTIVVRRLDSGPNATGSAFSVGYLVRLTDGREAFLKAIDFSQALSAADPARELQAMTEAFNFERDILAKCHDERLDYVVHAVHDGKTLVPSMPDGGVVQYLVFELADGDVRSQMQVSQQFDVAFSLRALHNIAVGMSQLHASDIAHQDVKPSNVLIFGDKSKLGDLGRASRKGFFPPHEAATVAGDPRYAPPELAYGFEDPDWSRRRLGCDLYHLGSMIVFFATGVGTTELLSVEIDPSLWPAKWGGTYDAVLPYVRDAFGRVLLRYRAGAPSAFREPLGTMV